MISPDKLQYIHGGQKRRKLALCFGALERDIIGCAENGCGYNFPSMTRREYIRRLVEIVLEDPLLASAEKTALEKLLQEEPLDEHRICNRARNALLAIIGTFPAEWDLIIAPHRKPASCEHILEPKGAENTGNLGPSGEGITRDFYPNLLYTQKIFVHRLIWDQFSVLQKQWGHREFFCHPVVVIRCILGQFALPWDV